MSPSRTKTCTFLKWFTVCTVYSKGKQEFWKVTAKFQLDTTPPCQSSVVCEQTYLYRNTDCKASLRLATYNNSIVCFLMRINSQKAQLLSAPTRRRNGHLIQTPRIKRMRLTFRSLPQQPKLTVQGTLCQKSRFPVLQLYAFHCCSSPKFPGSYFFI